MEKAKPVGMFLDAVKKWTHGQMEKGVSVPGYKLVNSFGNRQWTLDDEGILKKCKSRKINKRDATEVKLLSPAKLEKIAGKDFVASLTERPLKGTTVVPESDRRPAVERQDPSAEFAEVAQTESQSNE